MDNTAALWGLLGSLDAKIDVAEGDLHQWEEGDPEAPVAEQHVKDLTDLRVDLVDVIRSWDALSARVQAPVLAEEEQTRANGHRIELEFDGGSTFVKLLHPASGCKPASICTECGNDLADQPGRKGCRYCPDPEKHPCWLTAWVEEMGTDALAGKVTLSVIDTEWDGDGAIISIGEPASTVPQTDVGQPTRVAECPTCGSKVQERGGHLQPADDDDVGAELSRAEADFMEIADELDCAVNAEAVIDAIRALKARADRQPTRVDAEDVARLFHENYERLAPEFGYRTRDESAVPWEDVPEANRSLMVATARAVLDALSAHVTPEARGEGSEG